jgi:hypothetical protein
VRGLPLCSALLYILLMPCARWLARARWSASMMRCFRASSRISGHARSKSASRPPPASHARRALSRSAFSWSSSDRDPHVPEAPAPLCGPAPASRGGSRGVDRSRAWGRLGGRVTLHRYGPQHFSELARRRRGSLRYPMEAASPHASKRAATSARATRRAPTYQGRGYLQTRSPGPIGAVCCGVG